MQRKRVDSLHLSCLNIRSNCKSLNLARSSSAKFIRLTAVNAYDPAHDRRNALLQACFPDADIDPDPDPLEFELERGHRGVPTPAAPASAPAPAGIWRPRAVRPVAANATDAAAAAVTSTTCLLSRARARAYACVYTYMSHSAFPDYNSEEIATSSSS